MNRTAYLLIAASAVLAVVIYVASAPGCNPDPPAVDRAREHAERADSAEAAADTYAAMVVAMRDTIADHRTIIARLNERTRIAAENERRATRRADDLLTALEGIAPSAPDSVRLRGCLSAVESCTDARRESAALVTAQRVEIAALSDQVHRLTRLDSLRAGETQALRSALGEMRSAYSSMEAAYESERSARLSAKRRLWIERAAWVGVAVFAATR